MHADFTADLLAGLWSGGTRFKSEPHPLGNNSEFPPALRESQRLGLRLARIELRQKYSIIGIGAELTSLVLNGLRQKKK
jgi:hypothetical protein